MLARYCSMILLLSTSAIAGTHVIQDFEGRPSFGPNSRTYKPDGKAVTRYVADGPVGRWAAEIRVPPCSSGFWQITGLPSSEIAAARPTAFVFWHRAVDKPLRVRLILREHGGERWTVPVDAKPGEWHKEVVPLDRWLSIGGGKSDKELQLDQLAAFQFQFGKLTEPVAFQVDGLCLTSEPEHAAEAILAIPTDTLDFTASQGRLTANLGGTWGFMPAETLEYPPKGHWHKMRIAKAQVWKRNHWGKHSREWAHLKRAWYRRTFIIPDQTKGRRLRLRFMAVHAEADVYLNGQKVGRHVGGLTPFELDVTSVAELGEPNELIVGVAGPLAKGIETQPRGAMYRFHAGIWQPVYVIATARLCIENVFVTTSVRKQKLTVRTTLRNGSPASAEVRLLSRVLDGDTEVKRLPGLSVRLEPNETRCVEQELPWPDARLWSPDDPHLYVLHTEIARSGGPPRSPRKRGEEDERDGLEVRFGFREFWIDGHMFRLNGAKLRLKATWGHSGEWYYGRPSGIRNKLTALKEHNVNAVRYHGQPLPPEFLDAADEVGMLVIAESGLYHGPVHDNSLVHTREWVIRDRNHPSIIIWSGSNEFGHWIVPRDKTKTAFLLKQEQLIRSLDPTRPIMQHGYGPLDGKEQIYSIHYPERAIAMMPNTFMWPLGRGTQGRGGSQDHRIEINPAYPDFAWEQGKPLAIGEHLLGADGRSSLFWGDERYGQPDADWHAAGWLFRAAMNAYRVCGVAHVAPQVFQSSPGGKSVPNRYLEVIAKAFQHEGLFFENLGGHFWSRESLAKSVVVYNETLRPQSYDVDWDLVFGSRTVKSGQAHIELPPGELGRIRIVVELPQADRIVAGCVVAKLRHSGSDTVVATEALPIRAFPPTPKIRCTRAVGLFDPKGTTRHCLDDLGVGYVEVMAPTSVSEVRTLVIAKDALTLGIERHAQTIEQFVRAGGHVICLEQTAMPRWLPVPPQLVSEKGSPTETMAFNRPHPLVPSIPGSAGDALSLWRDDHVVTPISMHKPTLGNFTPVANSNLKLERCPLIELPVGKGVYIISQLALVTKFHSDPMAAHVLARMLEYCEWRKPREWPKAAALGTSDSRFVDTLQSDLKAQLDLARPEEIAIDGFDLLLTDAAALTQIGPTPLRAFVSSGGTLLLHGIEPDQGALLRELSGGHVHFADAEARLVRVFGSLPSERGYPNNVPPTWGMTNYDLAWESKRRGRLSPDRIKHRVLIKGIAVDQLTDMEGALLQARLGKGKIVINQFLWDKETYDTARAQRYASLLLTNLGVQMKALSLVPVSAKGYFFVDLRKYANASLVAPHGNDLRNLPTGQQEFRDVPFWIIPHDQNNGLSTVGLNNALVLPDGTRVEGNASRPMHIESIAVRKRVGRLVFLHSAGFSHSKKRYAKPKIAEYVVNYRGRAKERIPVRAQIEVTNWWNDWRQDLPNAKVAWKGSNSRTDKIAIYLLEWANPFPEREVESIDFRSAANPAWGISCIAISGLEVE